MKNTIQLSIIINVYIINAILFQKSEYRKNLLLSHQFFNGKKAIALVNIFRFAYYLL